MKQRSRFFIDLLSVAALAALPAAAMAGPSSQAKSVYEANGCASCHATSEKTVGPSLKAIARRYKGKPVSAELAHRIKAGSKGRWGDMPHPVIESISDSDAALLARWILQGAP